MPCAAPSPVTTTTFRSSFAASRPLAVSTSKVGALHRYTRHTSQRRASREAEPGSGVAGGRVSALHGKESCVPIAANMRSFQSPESTWDGSIRRHRTSEGGPYNGGQNGRGSGDGFYNPVPTPLARRARSRLGGGLGMPGTGVAPRGFRARRGLHEAPEGQDGPQSLEDRDDCDRRRAGHGRGGRSRRRELPQREPVEHGRNEAGARRSRAPPGTRAGCIQAVGRRHRGAPG
jgi:hypothetical protein